MNLTLLILSGVVSITGAIVAVVAVQRDKRARRKLSHN
jgi:hypothetical protein